MNRSFSTQVLPRVDHEQKLFFPGFVLELTMNRSYSTHFSPGVDHKQESIYSAFTWIRP